MNASEPQFTLISESSPPSTHGAGGVGQTCESAPRGVWHFMLRANDGSYELDVADEEASLSAERLELLAVVRGLEALDQPSRVTLLTRSGHVRRGLRFGLDMWRQNCWHWERFGQMVPVKNADLWQRVDRALAFHRVTCRVLRVDPPTTDLDPRAASCAEGSAEATPASRTASAVPRPHFPTTNPGQVRVQRPAGRGPAQGLLRRLFGWCGLGGTRRRWVIAAL